MHNKLLHQAIFLAFAALGIVNHSQLLAEDLDCVALLTNLINSAESKDEGISSFRPEQNGFEDRLIRTVGSPVIDSARRVLITAIFDAGTGQGPDQIEVRDLELGITRTVTLSVSDGRSVAIKKLALMDSDKAVVLGEDRNRHQWIYVVDLQTGRTLREIQPSGFGWYEQYDSFDPKCMQVIGGELYFTAPYGRKIYKINLADARSYQLVFSDDIPTSGGQIDESREHTVQELRLLATATRRAGFGKFRIYPDRGLVLISDETSERTEAASQLLMARTLPDGSWEKTRVFDFRRPNNASSFRQETGWVEGWKVLAFDLHQHLVALSLLDRSNAFGSLALLDTQTGELRYITYPGTGVFNYSRNELGIIAALLFTGDRITYSRHFIYQVGHLSRVERTETIRLSNWR
jgi:hypothetical protein